MNQAVTLAKVGNKEEFEGKFFPYQPERAVSVLLSAGAEILLDVSPQTLARLAELAALGFTTKNCLESVGLDATRFERVRKQAEAPATVDDGGAREALREIEKAIRFGRLQWQEFVGKALRTRIATDQAPTAALLAAKQTHGLGWTDQQEVDHGGTLKVEVTHRIIGKDNVEIVLGKAEDGTFVDKG